MAQQYLQAFVLVGMMSTSTIHTQISKHDNNLKKWVIILRVIDTQIP